MTRSQSRSKGYWIIGFLVFLLLVLHQDVWFWEDNRLVMAFLPIGLFWHLCLSIAASLTWALATVIAWPADEEDEHTPATESGEEAAT